MLSRLRGRDERRLGVAKLVIVGVALVLLLGSAPVVVAAIGWVVDQLT